MTGILGENSIISETMMIPKPICEYCGKGFKSKGNNERKYCEHNCYTRDQFWWKEDVAEVSKKIIEFKKVNRLAK
ncbi:hypothetical protein [Desulfofarcimen acetoxidans]|uniref:hypothetical protein n=1 Tax=Desulfofarcimen acetoxidans TaxID=58138 RepID=UPI0001A2F64F|nr:hypothetical protein [Desulfofarcimen acetoxidans]